MTMDTVLANTASPSYELSADQLEIRDQARKYFMSEFHPLQERMDNEDWWPEHMFKTLGGMGYLGQTVSEEYGGAGLDYLTSGVIAEAMTYANPGVAFSWLAHDNLCLNNIFRSGNDDQRRRYIPKMCSGELIGALGMTEPGAGSDALGSMRTRARRDGDHYILNGTKIFITNGPVADVLLVYAKTDMAKGNQGISAFIVEKEFEGFRVAQKLDKMGFRGSPLGELVFEDCKVPVENLVGEENKGARVMMSGLDIERVMAVPFAIGIAERALDLALDYAKTREQFGKPIASFQMIQSKLAEMYIKLEAARSFAYRVMTACDNMAHDQAGRGEIHKLTAATLFQSAEAASFIVDEAVQIHGGMGYMRETEINRLYRCTKVLEIAAGTQEVRKLIIAGEMLKD